MSTMERGEERITNGTQKENKRQKRKGFTEKRTTKLIEIELKHTETDKRTDKRTDRHTDDG